MKVLGCDMAAIRNMFLAEAGFIGLIGGVVGIVLSYMISAIINFVLRDSYYSNVSYIPPYLTLLALIFAVVIGMAVSYTHLGCTGFLCDSDEEMRDCIIQRKSDKIGERARQRVESVFTWSRSAEKLIDYAAKRGNVS